MFLDGAALSVTMALLAYAALPMALHSNCRSQRGAALYLGHSSLGFTERPRRLGLE